MSRALDGVGNLRLLSRFLASLTCQGFRQTTRELQTLAYEELQHCPSKPPTSTAFVLHGLLGSGRNWRSFSRNLLSTLSELSPPSNWRMILLDLRGHGRSAELEDLSPPHDLGSAAKDLADLIKHKGWAWPDVVMGHSLGGKVALQFLEDCATKKYDEVAAMPKQLWALDSVPGKVSPRESFGETEKVLETLHKLPSLIPSRKWLVDYLFSMGFSMALAQWLGSNLKGQGEHVRWAFNLECAVQLFNSYREREYWSVLEQPSEEGQKIGIVRADKSDRWAAGVVGKLEKVAAGSGGSVSVHVLPDSGHWVHVDNPQGLLHILAPCLASVS